MKTWAKVTLGILAVPVVLIAAGITILVATGRWQKVTGIAGGALRIKRGSDVLKTLDREFPFARPADGRLSEGRLLVYLDVCGAVQPVAEPFGAWVQEHQGQQGGLEEARDVTTQLGSILEASAKAMRDQRMSPREFEWITAQLRAARREVAEKAGSPVARDMLDALRGLERTAALSAPERQALTRKIEAWDGDLRRAGQPLTFNGELFLKHVDRIRALDVDDFLEALSGSGRRRRTHQDK